MARAFTFVELLIVICIIAMLSAIAVPNFLEAENRAKVSQVIKDQNRFAMALAAYQVDHRFYPPHWKFTPSAGYVGPFAVQKNINQAKWDALGYSGTNPYIEVPSFAVPGTAGHAIGLTTPVAYLPSYIPDEFGQYYESEPTFNYAQGPGEYLVWSQGPDGEDQLDGGGFSGSNHNAAEYILRGGQPLPSPYLIAGPMAGNVPPGAPASGRKFTYDPTNGTASTGDIWRVKNGRSGAE